VKRIIAIAFLAAACATAPRGGGNLSIAITPNPIVAKQIKGTVFEFPFDVVVRETGGAAVEINRVTADVFAFGSINVANETYDAARIHAMGHPTTIPANGEIHLHFAERHEVPDERLFHGVRAELRIDAKDERGAAITATTSVGVTH